jgi:hypothetical protein
MRQLKDSGMVIRTEDKRKAYFSKAWAKRREESFFLSPPIWGLTNLQ